MWLGGILAGVVITLAYCELRLAIVGWAAGGIAALVRADLKPAPRR
jgi:hypothetical protein